MSRAYVFQAALWCEDCGDRIIRRLIRERRHPEIRCNYCKFGGTVGRDAARKAFDNRSYSEWLECPKCGNNDAAWVDEDSDTFPQYVLDGGGESDSVEHCAAMERCLNAIDLPHEKDDCQKTPLRIGAWLGSALTSDGAEMLQEEIVAARAKGEKHSVLELWASEYADQLELRVFSWRLTFASYCGMVEEIHSTERAETPDEDRHEAWIETLAYLRHALRTGHEIVGFDKKNPLRRTWEIQARVEGSLVADSEGVLILERVTKERRK